MTTFGQAVPMRRGGRPSVEPGWRVDPGRYELRVGRSSVAIDHIVALEIVE